MIGVTEDGETFFVNIAFREDESDNGGKLFYSL
jgi:hypothetical protein